jgi:hypothetical protein
MSTPARDSGASCDQITQPPNGSFSGTPSRVTRVRPAPDGAMARRLIPWVVGLADRLEVRRNSETPGVWLTASSTRWVLARSRSLRWTAEKAASAAAGGRRAAVTITCSTGGGESKGMETSRGKRLTMT